MVRKIYLLIYINIDFCFYHIDKSGGTSLRYTFYNYFIKFYDKKNIHIPEYSKSITYNISSIEAYNIFKQNINYKNIKVLLCHSNFNHKNITSDFNEHFSVTCIRNPIDRLISHYYFRYYKLYKKKLIEFTDKELDDLMYKNNLCNIITKIIRRY